MIQQLGSRWSFLESLTRCLHNNSPPPPRQCDDSKPGTVLVSEENAANCISSAWREHTTRSATPKKQSDVQDNNGVLTTEEKRELKELLGSEVNCEQLLSDGSVARRRAALRRRFEQKMQGKTQQQRRVIARTLFETPEKDDSSDVDSIAEETGHPDNSPLPAKAEQEAFPIPRYLEAPSPRSLMG
mmetsp:Transcript_15845/g.33882  ORF Transcript_15845/g.33882 Transcript_15845/m.33882 type:complete len:186 (-) Transcript_15845:740-1297(-)